LGLTGFVVEFFGCAPNDGKLDFVFMGMAGMDVQK
jgi:hypothetical protein